MALASGSTPEKAGPRCCDSALAYNDAPAQQEQLQQVASSDAQPLAAAASACIGGEEVFEAPRAQVRCLHDHGGGNEDVYAEAVVHGITFTCAMVCVKCGRWAYQGEWEPSRTTSLRRRQYGYAYPNDPIALLVHILQNTLRAQRVIASLVPIGGGGGLCDLDAHGVGLRCGHG